ncbi:MAG: cytochrome c oxidase subunit [Solirubrobacterales bacterium]|nr:cytochrome c oxidase subunit [Solirubrobacterales bacterium]
MSVQAPPAAAPTPATDPDLARKIPGEAGIWVFILGDMLVFAIFFGMIVVLSAQHPELFRESQGHLNRTSGAVNTILLLTSSVLVAFAVRASRAQVGARTAGGNAPRLFAWALVCAGGFVIIKAIEYRAKLHAGFTPGTNDYFAYFYIFTGIHLLHLVIGMAVLTWLMRLSRRPDLTARDTMFVEVGASYWHMVDLLWIALFPLLYLMS